MKKPVALPKPQSFFTIAIPIDPETVKNLTLSQLIKHAEVLGLRVEVRIVKNETKK